MPIVKGMLRAVALLSLLALACDGETRYVAPTDVDDSWIRDGAAEAWASVGVDVPSDYTLLFLTPPDLADACNVNVARLEVGSQLGGCAAADDVVLLNRDNTPDQQLENLIHELGHLLRGVDDRRHLDCGADANQGTAFGSDVMCTSGAGPGGMPTERDAAFVR